MQLAGPQTTFAPQTTGHPMGLPEPITKENEKARVEPIVDRNDVDAALREGNPPIQFWRALSGEPDPETHTAPPSIMQIKISRLLEAQTQPDAPPANDPAALDTAEQHDTGQSDVKATAPASKQEASEVEDEDQVPTPPPIAGYEEVVPLFSEQKTAPTEATTAA